MRVLLVFLSTALLGYLIYLSWFKWQSRNPEFLYQTHCGSCHQAPNPQDLTREVWKKTVLPEMGARLGIHGKSDPYASMSPLEVTIMKKEDLYPANPIVDSSDWALIVDYVLSNSAEPNWDSGLTQELPKSESFSSIPLRVGDEDLALVTSIEMDSGSFLTTTVSRNFWNWSPGSPTELLFSGEQSAAKSVTWNNSRYLMEMGIINPTDTKRGIIWQLDANGKKTKLFGQLRRPVDFLVEDFNNDGSPEFIVCEFGNELGRLALIFLVDGRWMSKTLIAQPGAYHAELVDMDGDGLKDIVAGFSQGDEGIYIFYQRRNLNFSVHRVLEFSPLHGSNDFQLVDFDNNGALDLVVANGDNSDLSQILKPYHGIRIYLNDGNDKFQERWFYQMNGATGLEVADFDLDGDEDIVAISFFPDFQNGPKNSVQYLSNEGNYDFKASRIDGSTLGRWRTMSKGDIDRDGDIDLALGSFVYSPDNPPKEVLQTWAEAKTDVLLLTNQTVRDSIQSWD